MKQSSVEMFYDFLVEFQELALSKVPFGRGKGKGCSDEVITGFAERLSAASQAAADERINERILFITNEIERAS